MSLSSPWRADSLVFSAFAVEGLTYLDSAATTQKPQAVLDALNGYYFGGVANVHRAQHVPDGCATRAFEAARNRVTHQLHAVSPAEMSLTRGTTEAINLVGYGLERYSRPSDELLVSTLKHYINLPPWQQLALRRGLVLCMLPLDGHGVIDLGQARHIIDEHTRLLAISQLSSVLNIWQPVVELVQLVRECGTWTLVGGIQDNIHGHHDLPGLGCNFYAFSGHKLYSPDGVGVLQGHPQTLEQPMHRQFGGEMIYHTGFHEAGFYVAPLDSETGTPAVPAAIDLGTTIDRLATPGEAEITAHKGTLHARLFAGLLARDGVSLLGEPQAALASFRVDGVYVADFAHLPGRQDTAMRAGHHHAMPLLQCLKVPGALCVSLGLYSDADDLERSSLAFDRPLELLR